MSAVNLKCVPSKAKRPESGSLSWRRRRSPMGRPSLLLPPIPVLATRLQERSTRDFLSLESEVAVPSAPSPGQLFYNSEDHSDVTFIVGPEEWRFPAHSFVLGRDTLAALLMAAADHPRGSPPLLLKLPDMQPDLFEQILRYVYTGQASLSNAESTLRLLHASQEYHLPQLSSLCLSHLSRGLSPGCALAVLARLLAAPPAVRERADNERNELVVQCLSLVDRHADEVLRSEAFETLDRDLLLEIVRRDSLAVSSESLVFDALMRWACRACKRQRKELTPENKCLVLGRALYLVRYLTMTHEEFVRGPVSQGILSREDKEVILSRLTTNSNSPLPEKWLEGKVSVKRHIPHEVVSNVQPESVTSPTDSLQPVSRKKKSMSKKLLNGVGDLVICVIQLLD